MMKKFIAILTVALAFVSCQKTGVNFFKGNYSFKTSGYIYVAEGPDSEIRTINLPNEAGQMDITVIDAAAGKMLVTMNVTGGEMIVYYAHTDGDDLVLEPKHRVTSYSHDDFSFEFDDKITDFEAKSIEADYIASGVGRKYDNIILFNMIYEGTYTIDDTVYHIVGGDVACRAKVNSK